MKTKCFSSLLLIAGLIVFASSWLVQPQAADAPSFATYEYGTISWHGDDETHFIRPNGEVEFLGPLLQKVAEVDKADEKDRLMNVALNAVAKEGFELVSMESDVYVVRRPATR